MPGLDYAIMKNKRKNLQWVHPMHMTLKKPHARTVSILLFEEKKFIRRLVKGAGSRDISLFILYWCSVSLFALSGALAASSGVLLSYSITSIA